MTLHRINTSASAGGANTPSRKSSETPLIITVLGQVRNGLDEGTFNLIFTRLQFCIILLPGCSRFEPSNEPRKAASEVQADSMHPETKEYRDHYAILKYQERETPLAM